MAYVGAGSLDLARGLLYNAEAAIEGSEAVLPWQKAEVLCRTAKAFHLAEEKGHALEVWEKAITLARLGERSEDFQESRDSSSVLREIANDLMSAGERNRAEALLQAITRKSP